MPLDNTDRPADQWLIRVPTEALVAELEKRRKQEEEKRQTQIGDLCPYCKTKMHWDQWKEVLICPSHGRFDFGVTK